MFLIGAAVQSSGIPPSFYGALIGSFVSGSVAVGILAYNTYQKNKEYNFKCYGAMKSIIIQLKFLRNYTEIVTNLLYLLESFPERKEEVLEYLKDEKKRFLNANQLLEKEKGNIPYNFVRRCYEVIDKFNEVLIQFDRIERKLDEQTINFLNLNLNWCIDTAVEFIDNSEKYITEVEKKYKIKEYY
ncbi:hypothetical protein ACFVSS_25150 [Peribacillus butanolivorans]|uniref:hypothetical protein n=1 Tax=Peribacillus butanolivorans TaxID=421767 RepID=UPI0036DEF2A0